jgi:hypothetical protein
MQFRIYIVDGTLASLHFDQVAHCRFHVGFKEVCVGFFKLATPFVEVFDAVLEIEWLRFTLLDVGNQRCPIEKICMIRIRPVCDLTNRFH